MLVEASLLIQVKYITLPNRDKSDKCTYSALKRLGVSFRPTPWAPSASHFGKSSKEVLTRLKSLNKHVPQEQTPAER